MKRIRVVFEGECGNGDNLYWIGREGEQSIGQVRCDAGTATRLHDLINQQVSVPHDLIEDIVYHLQCYDNSSTRTNAGHHLNELYNKVGDLKTWHPTYDPDTGTIAYERDEV